MLLRLLCAKNEYRRQNHSNLNCSIEIFFTFFCYQFCNFWTPWIYEPWHIYQFFVYFQSWWLFWGLCPLKMDLITLIQLRWFYKSPIMSMKCPLNRAFVVDIYGKNWIGLEVRFCFTVRLHWLFCSTLDIVFCRHDFGDGPKNWSIHVQWIKIS